MAYTGQLSPRQHGQAMTATLIAVFLVGYGLLIGLNIRVIDHIGHVISAVSVTAPESPKEPVTEKAAAKPAPPNRQAKPVPVVVRMPEIIPPLPTQMELAPVAGTDVQASAGAAPQTGPGTGAAGVGNGLGSGDSGTGTGTGGGGGKAVWRSGRIHNRDYPREASRENITGVVDVQFTVLPNGRVTGCSTSRSSGSQILDATTCRLIEKRFRFKPATNAVGKPVASLSGWRQSWWLEPR